MSESTSGRVAPCPSGHPADRLCSYCDPNRPTKPGRVPPAKRPFPPDTYSDGMLSMLIEHNEREAKYARERADYFETERALMIEEQQRRKDQP